MSFDAHVTLKPTMILQNVRLTSVLLCFYSVVFTPFQHAQRGAHALQGCNGCDADGDDDDGDDDDGGNDDGNGTDDNGCNTCDGERRRRRDWC